MFSKVFYLASLQSYYTFYLIQTFGVSVQTSQVLLFVFLAAVAAGTYAGGPIGDRYGRKFVIWLSILGVLPFTLLLPHLGLVGTAIDSVCIGLVLSSAFSAIVVYAQELTPGNVGAVAGLFFGLSFGLGGVGAALLGFLADKTSLSFVYQVCAFLPAIGLLTYFLPDLHARRLSPSAASNTRHGRACPAIDRRSCRRRWHSLRKRRFRLAKARLAAWMAGISPAMRDPSSDTLRGHNCAMIAGDENERSFWNERSFSVRSHDDRARFRPPVRRSSAHEPAAPERQADHARRDHIAAAAERAFVRHGFHAATMQQVAEEAGMSAGNLYRYFPSKEALVEGICLLDQRERGAAFHALAAQRRRARHARGDAARQPAQQAARQGGDVPRSRRRGGPQPAHRRDDADERRRGDRRPHQL